MTKLDELMSKEMTRRQFLMTLGFGFLSMFGVSALLGSLTSGDSGGEAMKGYGARTYGS